MPKITRSELKILKYVNKHGGATAEKITEKFGQLGMASLARLIELGYVDKVEKFEPRD